MQNKCSFVAIDSNVFFDISHMNQAFVKKQKNNSYRSIIRDLKNLNESNHVKFIILPTVLEEILRGMNNLASDVYQREIDFLYQNCIIYIPKDYIEYDLETKHLAQEYIKTKLMEGDKNINDAYIMAEASVLGLNLLSSNFKHFIYYNYLAGFEFNRQLVQDRAIDIQNYNASTNLKYINEAGIEVVPRAYSVQDFLSLFRTGLFMIDENRRKDLMNLYEKQLESM